MDDALDLSARPAFRRWAYGLILAVAAATLLADLVTVDSPMQSANDRSRWCTVWSLVHRGTYTIDEIIRVPGWDSIDKVRKDGHFYSSKPALLPTILAGLYWVLKTAFGLDLIKHKRATISLLLILVNWIPWLLAQAIFARSLERFARHDFTKLLLVLALAFGTLLTPFQVTLNNHTLAATWVIFALAPVLAMLAEGRRESWRFVACGFAAAFTVCNEMPAAPFGVATFLICLRLSPRHALFAYTPAALIPLIAFFVTTRISTGGFKPFQTEYGSEIYRYVFEGVPSYWMNPGGIDRSNESTATYLLHCTIGHHGWLSLTPLFLLVFPGWVLGTLRRPAGQASNHSKPAGQQLTPWRPLALLSFLLTLWVFGFYLSRTENYNYGGNTAGLRWTFWLIPLWLWTLVPALDAWSHLWAFRGLMVGLLAVSVFSAAMPRHNPWRPPWLQVLMQDWGWVNYSDPKPRFPTRKIWLNPYPKTDGANATLAGVTRDGALKLTVTAVRRELIEGRTIGELAVIRDHAGTSRTLRLLVDVEEFNKGRSAEECLKHPGWGQGPWADLSESTPEMLVFLRGMPVLSNAVYTVVAERYLKTPMRTNAFHCRQAAAAIDQKQRGESQTHRIRRDVWLSDEVPFGLVQIEDTVMNPQDSTIEFKERLQLVGFQGNP